MDKLCVNEIFYSIQGEGPFQGRPAVFIRLSGCNLSCTFCDTEHDTGELLTPQQILDGVRRSMREFDGVDLPLLVITGGEPFAQTVVLLLALCVDGGYHVHLETNGTLAPDDIPPKLLEKMFIVCSPKTGHPINLVLGKYIDIYKLLVEEQTQDAEIIPYILTQRPVYLQPLHNGNIGNNRERTIELCKKYNLGFSPQLQKLIGVE